MSTTGTSPESIFRGFTPAQAAHYSNTRGAYPADLYKFLISHHLFTGGHSKLVVDVGCGPGNSTRDLATLFDHAVGVDPSEGMIKAAADMGGTTGSGEPIRYVVAAAEKIHEMEQIGELGMVDLLTAATAVSANSTDDHAFDVNVGGQVHWFDMPKFWEAAAKIVKPGGTVAFWQYGKVWLRRSSIWSPFQVAWHLINSCSKIPPFREEMQPTPSCTATTMANWTRTCTKEIGWCGTASTSSSCHGRQNVPTPYERLLAPTPRPEGLFGRSGTRRESCKRTASSLAVRVR
jgi:SAM-dependent methyltransferase